LTLVEIMVAVGLVGIACALALGAQVRLSSVLRSQSVVSRAQSTLRAAGDAIARDVQMAGYLASSVWRAGQADPLAPVTVVNGGSGPDQITVLYADASVLKLIPQAGNDSGTYKSTTGTLLASTAGFAAGQLVLATHIAANGPANAPSVMGQGCLLLITAVTSDHIVTSPGASGAWTVTGNAQCDHVAAVWNDGYTAFARPVLRSYRIAPDDVRGVLQMSPTGGIADDWQDVAIGIIDLQVALRVYQKDKTSDEDADGDPERDWFSGDNMDALPEGASVTQVSITLLAKGATESGTTVVQTPDLIEDGKDAAYNRIGDVHGTTLPVASTASPYHGDLIFRSRTVTLNLRNSSGNR
jgi:type II secretory pathway pseudopilin PulG